MKNATKATSKSMKKKPIKVTMFGASQRGNSSTNAFHLVRVSLEYAADLPKHMSSRSAVAGIARGSSYLRPNTDIS